jgi:hypothetical protein
LFPGASRLSHNEGEPTVARVKPLPDLIKDRLAELGSHGKPLSVRAAARASGGKISHAQLSAIANGYVGSVTDRVLEGIPLAIDVPRSEIYAAHGVRRPHDSFRLPPEADRLTRRQREAVLSVVRAMLDPGSEQQQPRREPAPPSGPGLRRVARKKT